VKTPFDPLIGSSNARVPPYCRGVQCGQCLGSEIRLLSNADSPFKPEYTRVNRIIWVGSGIDQYLLYDGVVTIHLIADFNIRDSSWSGC
jgi:hypothetical protein